MATNQKPKKIPVLGSIIKTAIDLREKISLIDFGRVKNPRKAQEKVLRKLLQKASHTHFGDAYKFPKILKEKDLISAFKNSVPTFDYDSLHKAWWHRTLTDEPYVCWPGKTKYFALSSGTSGASSKYIPITPDMNKQIQKTSMRQIFSLAKYDFPAKMFGKGMLMLGGSTNLQQNGAHYEGDLSGITAGKIPFWFQHYYKPGKRISKERDWQVKLNEIVKNAPNWDLMAIVGVPAWFVVLMEKIVETYQVKTIHDIWPNLRIFCHGGVSIEPYRKSLDKLFGQPVTFIETYLASEGFLAYQSRPNARGMELVLDNGIFFEFVPFNNENFDDSYNLKPNPQTLTIDEIEEGKDYAILITTCAGAYRYLIGDTVRLVDKEYNEIIITGRTKFFLSLCGEHLSVDNMTVAVKRLSDTKNIEIPEFCVIGEEHGNMFAHRWFLACDEPLDPAVAVEKIDQYLGEVNDDYRTERLEAIRDVSVEIFPTSVFYDYMRLIGKEGAQNKFPRVLRGEKMEHWLNYLKNKC
ncbi:MAG: GH3 auxin-responsive promoter family protein [Bacteroidales bacterium]|nr:GH3 auxin-responsive promoter family protein [Bacteroidales bacterium]